MLCIIHTICLGGGYISYLCDKHNVLGQTNLPQIVSLQFENPHILEPVEGEARDLDQPVLVQLEDLQALQVDEHLTDVVMRLRKSIKIKL